MRTWCVLVALGLWCVTAGPPVASPAAAATISSEERLRNDLEAAEEAIRDSPDDFEDRLALAKAWYFLAVEEERGALKQADKRFKALAQAYPDDPRVTAYYGSVHLLRSRATWAVWDKEKLARAGVALMDAAVDAAEPPHDLEVRLVRSMTTLHLPEWFGLRPRTVSDFAWLAERAQAGAEAGTFAPRFAAAALYHHGLYEAEAGRDEAAKRAWEAAVKVAPKSAGGRDAAAKLAE